MELTPVEFITKDAIAKWKRVIEQALLEGAAVASIDTYLQSQGVQAWDKYRREVCAKTKLGRGLGAGELIQMGGRSKFRALFGLEPIPEVPIEEYDYPLTESGDSEKFAEMNAEALKYDHRQARWLIADEESGLWLPDKTDTVLQMALDSMRERQKVGVNYTDHAKRKSMTDWALHGENRARLNNLIALAEHRDELKDTGEDFDKDAFLLGCPNGVVDLRTGLLTKARPDQKVTMRVRVPYDPEAQCPVWLKTLSEVFGPNEHITEAETPLVVGFIHRALGYSITGDCREECCFFCWGDGANGKGTIINTVGFVLADYNDDMPMATLEKNIYKSQGIPNDVAKLVGKRYVTCTEVQEFSINESRLKAITGRDPLTARFLNQEFFTFEPVCKIWIATNKKPKIQGTDDGIWRRIHLVPFTHQFEGVNNNKKLKDHLKHEELQGILTWLVKGAMLWLAEGLNPPQTVKVATEEYRHESDPLTPFFEQRCIVSTTKRCQAGTLWAEYLNFAQYDDNKMSDKTFHKALKKRFQFEVKASVTFYKGIGLLSKDQAGTVPESGAEEHEAGAAGLGPTPGEMPF